MKSLPRLIDDAGHTSPVKKPATAVLEMHGYWPAVSEKQELTQTTAPMRIHLIDARDKTANVAAQEAESLLRNFNAAGVVFLMLKTYQKPRRRTERARVLTCAAQKGSVFAVA